MPNTTTTMTVRKSSASSKQNQKARTKTANNASNRFHVVVCPEYGFPRLYRSKLFYQELVSISLSAGVYNKYIFSLNGLYDPNITGSGSQPGYFSQLMAIWDQYAVITCRSVVEFSTVGTGNYTVGTYVDDDTTVATTLAIALRQPSAITHQFTYTSDQPMTIVNNWSSHKWFNNPTPWIDDQLQGNSGNNPSEQSYLVLFAEDATGATTTLTAKVRLEYEVMFTEPKTVA